MALTAKHGFRHRRSKNVHLSANSLSNIKNEHINDFASVIYTPKQRYLMPFGDKHIGWTWISKGEFHTSLRHCCSRERGRRRKELWDIKLNRTTSGSRRWAMMRSRTFRRIRRSGTQEHPLFFQSLFYLFENTFPLLYFEYILTHIFKFKIVLIIVKCGKPNRFI